MDALAREQEASFLSSFVHHDDEAIARPQWMPLRPGMDGYPEFQDELIVREVFESADGRILGTEWTIYRVYEGYRGYRWQVQATSTHHFHRDADPSYPLGSEAGKWREALDAARSCARAQGGSTREWIEKLADRG